MVGEFGRGELVTCVDETGHEVAKGLVNYDASEAAQICGHSTQRIESILGYAREPELIHRDSLAIV